MSIKESSDELNPNEIVAEVVAPRRRRSLSDYLALAIATCGVGYFPVAPGTWGSLVGVGLFLLLRSQLTGSDQNPNPQFIAVDLFVVITVSLVGVWAATRTEKLSGRKDPGKVVIDEVAGQLVSLLPLLVQTNEWKLGVIVSFILFRFFDIVKPYPARQCERLRGGLGIMADDLVAGVYAAGVVVVVITVVRWFKF